MQGRGKERCITQVESHFNYATRTCDTTIYCTLRRAYETLAEKNASGDKGREEAEAGSSSKCRATQQSLCENGETLKDSDS